MKPLTATNIEQSFRRLVSGETGFHPDFQAIADADPTYDEPFAIHGITLRPVLYQSGTAFGCAQTGYFGFYAFQRAIRGLLLGVNHLVGGKVLLAAQLHGPAVAAYYTAAYHAVHGFLALAGRVFLDSTSWPIASHRPPGDKSDRFIAVLTRNNRWLLELRPRNHRSRWSEVRQVYATDGLPECFQTLFSYLYCGCYQRGVDIVEIVRNPAKYRIQLADKLDEFLGRIAETRHESLYASFGSDPQVMEALWNGEAFTERGIENQAIHFGGFAHGLLTEVAVGLNTLADRLDMTPDVRNALALSAFHPWFDTPRIDQIANDELRQRIQSVDDWLSVDIAVRAKKMTVL